MVLGAPKAKIEKFSYTNTSATNISLLFCPVEDKFINFSDSFTMNIIIMHKAFT